MPEDGDIALSTRVHTQLTNSSRSERNYSTVIVERGIVRANDLPAPR